MIRMLIAFFALFRISAVKEKFKPTAVIIKNGVANVATENELKEFRGG